MGWFFSDYRVSPNFLLCWGWVVVEVGLGCDNKTIIRNSDKKFLVYVQFYVELSKP